MLLLINEIAKTKLEVYKDIIWNVTQFIYIKCKIYLHIHVCITS